MARPRKTIAELKLKGTYRKDRHEDRKIIETQVSDLSTFEENTIIIPPKTLTDKYVIDYFKMHTNLLIKLRILNPVDLPELEMMYEILQQSREIQKEIKKTDIIKEFNRYEKLIQLSIKLSNRFSQLASKYYISPSARTHLQLDNLELENKKIEAKSIVQKLINKK